MGDSGATELVVYNKRSMTDQYNAGIMYGRYVTGSWVCPKRARQELEVGFPHEVRESELSMSIFRYKDDTLVRREHAQGYLELAATRA